MRKIILLLFVIVLTISSQAEIFEVGSTKTYVKPSQVVSLLNDGDTVYIDAGIYSGDACAWYANNIYIKGIDGLAHLKADGAYSQGKAIWVIAGDNYIIENIEFSECKVPDHNGAGIRAEGTDLTIRHCYFHDNENGILTTNDDECDLLIEYCEFENNGYGDGYTHNMYINHIKSFTFRFNYTHHSNIGHTIKTRAHRNEILFNRIMDENSGIASMLIDVPNGGFTIVMGNIIMQGPNATNKTMMTYGSEGLSNPEKSLYVVNNTFVNERSTCNPVSIANDATANIYNNIFVNTGDLSGNINDSSSNMIFDKVESVSFTDASNYVYHLKKGSKCIDAGKDLGFLSFYPMVPHYQYKYDKSDENRPSDSKIDIGAFEYKKDVGIEDVSVDYRLFPNPVKESLILENLNTGSEILIYDQKGKLLCKQIANGKVISIDFKERSSGVYLVKVIESGKSNVFKIIHFD
jgi:hypothetical protein